MASLRKNHRGKSVGTLLLLSVLQSFSCVPAVEAVFGIPDFLEYGTCANVTLMENFDPVKYTGLWFDIASVPNEYQQTKACVSHKYTWTDDHMNVVSRGLSETEQKIRQSLVFLLDEERQPPNPAQMKVIAEGTPESPYQVITTDYRRYSCVYSCLEYFGFRAEFIWLYSRTPTLAEHFASRCHDALTTMGVDYTKMINIKQDETCPYYKKLDQLLKNNKKLMDKTLGPELPTTTLPPTTTPTTTRPPTTTTTTTTIPPITTTSATTRPPTTTIEDTTPPTTSPTTTTTTTTIPFNTTPATTPPTTTLAITIPPTTTPVATDPPTTTPATTDPPTTTPVTTLPPTTTSTTSSPTTTTTTSPAPRPRPSFTLTSGRAAQGTPPEETAQELDEQSEQEEKVTASRQQTVFSGAEEVTPSGGTWKRDHEMTQGSTAGLASRGVGPVGGLLLLLPLLMGAAPIMVLR